MKTLRILFVFFTLSSTALAGGGSDVGNGTDNPAPETGSAWFLGADKTVSYCMEIAPGFGANLATLDSAMSFALATWKDYIESHDVQRLLAKDSGGRMLSLRWNRLAACDGKEDLKFAFGSDDEVIRQEKRRLDHPTAFALRTTYDATAGWAKGLVWLSSSATISPSKHFPDWSNDNTARQILLHELGHVFGVSHVQNTIMDSDLSGQLLRGESVPPKIDQRNQLVACWNCRDYQLSGRLGYDDPASGDSTANVFRRFMGREAKGAIRAEIRGSPTSFALFISDIMGSREVELKTNHNGSAIHTGFDRGERIFRVAWQDNSGSHVRNADIFNGGIILYGSVLDASKKPLNLIVEVNAHSLASPGPITLRWLEDGKAHALFFANKQ